MFDRAGPSTNRSEIAWLKPTTERRVTVSVEDDAVKLVRTDGEYDGPPLRVALVAVGSASLEGLWMFGDEIELAWTRDPEGVQVVTGIPMGATLQLTGVDSGGTSKTERFTVGSDRRIVWR